jgi:hypothetical protein
VAILGALVNAKLKTDLRQRLTALHVPSIFQGPIITSYEHGGTGKGGALSGFKQLFPTFFHRVLDAAYSAFRSGLSAALVLSAILIGIAAVIAGYAASRGGDSEQPAP